MTIVEALERRIPRIRQAKWARENAYLRLPLLKNGHGPWAEIYDPQTQGLIGERPGSQRLLVIGSNITDDDFEIYRGPISEWEDHPDNFASVYEEG